MTTKQVQVATATEHQRVLTRRAIRQAIKHEQQQATSKRPITLPRLAWMERPFLVDEVERPADDEIRERDQEIEHANTCYRNRQSPGTVICHDESETENHSNCKEVGYQAKHRVSVV